MKKVAILQSNYIPWKGYFDLIGLADEFIFLDTVQYSKGTWRNRNKIKTSNSLTWLTVPVLLKGKDFPIIKNVKIKGAQWIKDHWKTLELNYKKSKYYKEVSEFLEPLYFGKKYVFLSELNKTFILEILKYLNIETKISDSTSFDTSSEKSNRVIDLVKRVDGNIYISGPAAKNYIDENYFRENGIEVFWMDYSNYPQYEQLWGTFQHEVSILDMIFNCGKDSVNYMKIKKSKLT